MNFLKSTGTIYIGFALGIAAIVAGVFFPEYSGILWTVAGLFGAGSVEAMRLQIDSKGWKTHALVIVVVAIAILQWIGVVTPEMAHTLYVAFGPLIGITVTQALVKSPTASIQPASK